MPAAAARSSTSSSTRITEAQPARVRGLGVRLGAEPAPALRAEQRAVRQTHDELAADEALEARAAQERVQLLVERAVERRDSAHSARNTPVTLPRIWTWSA